LLTYSSLAAVDRVATTRQAEPEAAAQVAFWLRRTFTLVRVLRPLLSVQEGQAKERARRRVSQGRLLVLVLRLHPAAVAAEVVPTVPVLRQAITEAQAVAAVLRLPVRMVLAVRV
jgi:hypothetical protein